MSVTKPFNYEELVQIILKELRNSQLLNYVSDDSIIYVDQANIEVVPEFRDYLIRLSPPESGFVVKVPKIGQYFTNNYIVAIELWVKAPQNVAMGMNRLLSGSLIGRKQKGPSELFQDVSKVLEHNRFSEQLDSYPGSNIGDPVGLSQPEKNLSGVGFLWLGRQNNVA